MLVNIVISTKKHPVCSGWMDHMHNTLSSLKSVKNDSRLWVDIPTNHKISWPCFAIVWLHYWPISFFLHWLITCFDTEDGSVWVSFRKQPCLKIVYNAHGLWCEISRLMKYKAANRVPHYFLMWFDFSSCCQWQTCVLPVRPVFHVFYTEMYS